MIKNKKAAMFGFDARVALAIFGVLSIIAGASLYSVMKEVKIKALATQLQEIAKAYEQFYLDTGQHSATILNAETLRSPDLVIAPAGVTGWKGPYIKASIPSTSYIDSISPLFGRIYFKLGSIDVAWSNPSLELPSNCSLNCYVWVEVIGTNSPSGV